MRAPKATGSGLLVVALAVLTLASPTRGQSTPNGNAWSGGVSKQVPTPPPVRPPRTPPPDETPPGGDERLQGAKIEYRRGTQRDDRRRLEPPDRRDVEALDVAARLDAIDEMLLEERWRNARNAAESLADEILDGGHTRRDLGEILGRLALQRALADAQQGLWSWAAWRWDTALALDPSIASRDLDEFGEVGRWLSSLGRRYAGQLPEGASALRRPWPRDLDPATLRQRPAPRRLVDHPEWRERPVHTVEVLIDRFGQMSRPVVIDADRAHPAFVYLLLDAIWQRRPASPATRGDEKVNVLHEIRVEALFPDLRARGRW